MKRPTESRVYCRANLYDRFGLSELLFERILVCCVGNICRSPIAEALLRQEFLALGRAVEVRSAGLGALVGRPADESVQLLMGRRDVDVSGHRAIQVNRDMLHWADLVLVMDKEQREALRLHDPVAAGKIFLLGHWIGREIPDPYRADLPVYEQTLELIDRAVASWMERL